MKYIISFIVGGIFCLIAQILVDKTRMTPARILVGYVTVGVILTALGLYKPLVDFASCGATTPLTGFGYLLADGVKKSVQERGIAGAFTGGLTSAAGGIAAAIFFGYIVGVIFKGKSK